MREFKENVKCIMYMIAAVSWPMFFILMDFVK